MEPWAVVNTAGFAAVDHAEQDPDRCYRENTIGPEILAQACAEQGLQLLTFSSDLVFDGLGRDPYLESDRLAPLSCYGRSKAEAERRVMAAYPAALVVRTSSLFGPWDQQNFLSVALGHLREGRRFSAASDAIVSPTFIPDLVHACLDLVVDCECGVWHLANIGAISWFEFAARGAELLGIDRAQLKPQRLDDMSLAAPRPAYSVLGSERGLLLPSLDDALLRYTRATT
jgi:dTDP-4-dehydrorhamnose reductase